MNEFIKKLMEENGLELKTNVGGTALYYNGVVLPNTVNKDELFLQGYICGFARRETMLHERKPLIPSGRKYC